MTESNIFLHVAKPIVEDPIPPGCDNDDECPLHKKCRNRLCIDPCIRENPCAVNALCKVQDHNAQCSCPEGYFGDPKVKCEKRKYFSSTNEFLNRVTFPAIIILNRSILTHSFLSEISCYVFSAVDFFVTK